jgi:hypothetical protein
VLDEFPEVPRLVEASLSVEDSGLLVRKTETEEERDMRGSTGHACKAGEGRMASAYSIS